jgi:benzoyl-CoA reductase subunit BamB
MQYGYAGKILEIDLSLDKIYKSDSDLKSNEAYLGGRGTNTKIFWDRVSPEVTPFSPDNLLIFGAGVLTGTVAPGANRTAITTKSPVTNLLTYSNLGGFWGPELKYAGYDTLIISGKSPKPVYLWINDDVVEIRDAAHLWGKDVRETGRILRAEHNRDMVQIICIGPAGEKKVNAATIEHGFGASASRAGIGAIMGDKNVKAIVLHGTKDIAISDSANFEKLCERVLKRTDKLKAYFDNWANDLGVWLGGDGVYGNFEEVRNIPNFEQILADFEKRFKHGTVSCYNCGVACKFRISLSDEIYSFAKCQSYFNFMFACKIQDLAFSIKCFNLCERYGLDVVSTAQILAFAIDLYQKGILTKSDTDGMHIESGNQEIAFSLIEKIAKRDGFGDVLANGVYQAARLIGKGAEAHAYHLKKLEPIPYLMYRPYVALRSSITDRADATRAEGFLVQDYLAATKDWKLEFIKEGFFSYPKDLKKLFLEDFVGLERDYETIVPFTVADADKNNLADSTGVCIFWTGFWVYNPMNLDDHIKLVSYATGIDIDETKGMTIAKRIGALTRAYNILSGIRRKDDTVPEKFFHDPPKPPRSLLNRDKFNKMISQYYKLRGWNEEGVPTKDELDRLELQYVRRKFEERGIL